MHELFAQAILAHMAAQSIFELLALLGPFAVVFGAGAILVINPIIRSQGDRYQHQPIRGDEKPQSSNGNSTKPSRAAASSQPTEEDQVAASSGTPPGEE